MLVISPSSARFHWCDEFKKWLPDPDYLPPESVHVITSEKMAARTFLRRPIGGIRSISLTESFKGLVSSIILYLDCLEEWRVFWEK